MWACVSARLALRLDLELVHGGFRVVGYRQWPPGPPRERKRTHGGVAINAVVLALFCNEGCEQAPAAHRRLLLTMPDAGPLQVHHVYLPRQVGAMER
jgi:hypothetical protein